MMASKLTSGSTIQANNMKMPVIGLGTWQSPDKDIEIALNAALDAGYRHIDTAYSYMNEGAIGRTLQKIFAAGKIKREDLFITTKLPMVANRAEHVEVYLKKSLAALQLDYVDLFLIHHPIAFQHSDVLFPKGPDGEFLFDLSTNHLATWEEMEKQVDAGRAKAIGVSNFNITQLKRIVDNSRIKPANIQVEMHIYVQQNDLVDYCNKNNVTICAYAPLGSPSLIPYNKQRGLDTDGMVDFSPMKDPVIKEIADKHGKQPSHVLLRFLVQRGIATIPKSTNPDRIKQNIDIFDFELDESDMKRICALDKGEDGRMFNRGFLLALKKHPEYPY